MQRTHHRLSDAPFTRQSFLVAEQSRAGETTVKPHASKNEGGPAVFVLLAWGGGWVIRPKTHNVHARHDRRIPSLTKDADDAAGGCIALVVD